MVKVKICGITSAADALMAIEAGADALGFVFYEKSPRNVSAESAAAIIRQLPPFVQMVGLFVNAGADHVNAIADRCGLDLVQLHGDESPEFCRLINRRVIKALRVKDASSLEVAASYEVAGLLLDAWSPAAYGGTGHTFNWELAAQAGAAGPIILAGGLTPENVGDAVSQVRPYAVDVSSGVELSPGQKCPDKVREFIRQARIGGHNL